MSSLHKAEISGILLRWLERYVPPAAMKENARAQQDEAESLLAVLLKFAPAPEPGQWVHRVLRSLDYRVNKYRSWPTTAELAEACSDILKDDPKSPRAEGLDMRPEAITARRMEKGEPVGESWLYGRQACELIASGLITKAQMDAYRSGAFLQRREAYGEAEAIAWEAEAKQRHEDAREIHRQQAAKAKAA